MRSWTFFGFTPVTLRSQIFFFFFLKSVCLLFYLLLWVEISEKQLKGRRIYVGLQFKKEYSPPWGNRKWLVTPYPQLRNRQPTRSKADYENSRPQLARYIFQQGSNSRFHNLSQYHYHLETSGQAQESMGHVTFKPQLWLTLLQFWVSYPIKKSWRKKIKLY